MPDLWKRFSKADVLIYLDAQVQTIAARQQRSDWTQERLDVQRQRLAHAREHCDLYLATDDLTREEVAEGVKGFLRSREIVPCASRQTNAEARTGLGDASGVGPRPR